jgi:hypothetical protein
MIPLPPAVIFEILRRFCLLRRLWLLPRRCGSSLFELPLRQLSV